MVVYEYPLNEKIRTWLRFARVFGKFRSVMENSIQGSDNSCWDAMAFHSLFEMVEITDRSDLKNDLIKELIRLNQYHDKLSHSQEVDLSTLTKMQEKTDKAINKLRDMPGKPGQILNSNTWFNLLHTRMAIPGGCNDFDVPSLHWWKTLSLKERADDINNFFEIFIPLEEAVNILLLIIRESAEDEKINTYDGSAVISANCANVLIQVKIDDNLSFFPEVSANRFQVNIRLMALQKDIWENREINQSSQITVRQCFSPMGGLANR